MELSKYAQQFINIRNVPSIIRFYMENNPFNSSTAPRKLNRGGSDSSRMSGTKAEHRATGTYATGLLLF
ncbi:hypothetical protein FW774_14205 [Pedobacter sp. BS3]|uniref:hypothetical protein n=1 Tax=Pedobacter sp. BS3 TaxID=2567937 RepID=UPI0011EEA00A|nr:hypothetical protein [Pedobacter sp. BS3]TZF82652.1 hypothetical protein FW774_14205 [Pedobacter sp. BS3]